MNTHSIRKQNCLSLIKLVAAIQVMIIHMREHLDILLPEWVNSIIRFFAGVPIFFIVSGFLIWFSIENSFSYGNYIKKRFWRIYPELWVAVIFEIISIIIFYSGWKIKDLFIFSFTQGTFFQFWMPDSLRGYGCGTPNGALWTICVMVQFYIIAWFVHNLLHKKKAIIWSIVFLAIVGISIVGDTIVEKIGNAIIIKLYKQTIIKYGWLFYMGCFIAEFFDKLLSAMRKYWFILVLGSVLAYLTSFDLFAGYWVLWSVLLVSGLIGFAYAFPKFSVKTDISYGLFLYHMIVVNVFIQMGWVRNSKYVIIAILITGFLAYISTITIGSWSEKMKRYSKA